MMSVAAGRPPSLSNHETSAILTKHFNFKAVIDVSIKAFPSYRDRNYFFQGDYIDESTNAFVFKLSNPLSTSLDVMEGVNQVMKHLNSRSLLSPYPLSSQTGRDVFQLSGAELKDVNSEENIMSAERKKDGDSEEDNVMKYPVYVLSFIPGQIFDHVEKKHITPALLYEVGELLGKIDKELMV